MALSWYKIIIPKRYNLTQKGYFGSGFGNFFVKASDKKEALSKGVRKFRAMRSKYKDFHPVGTIKMSEFKAVKISQHEAEEEYLTPSQQASYREWKRKHPGK